MQAETVAVVLANPALSSILTMTLSGSPHLRVRAFETLGALSVYSRVAPVALVVMDFDLDAARRLREAPDLAGPRFDLVALAASVDAELPALSRRAGIDEVLLKPMSPRYLLERVLSRLARRVTLTGTAAPVRQPVRRPWSHFGDNIVPLFPELQPQG